MRRVISLLLAFVILVSAFASLVGCSSNAAKFTMGKWLTMINDAFGMTNYTSQEPYFKSVGKTSPYFGAVQIAAEWDVVDKDKDLDAEKTVTWREALLTLVNCGSFVSDDTADEDKISYAISHFDNSIRNYWLDREIKNEEATVLLATAQEQWANRKYEVPVETHTFADGVQDYTKQDNKVDNYSYSENSGVVTIPASENVNISDGDVFVLPGNKDSMGAKAFRAKEVEQRDGSYVISVDNDLDLYDIAQDLYVEETLVPTADNTVIRDGNGNIVSVGADTPLSDMNSSGGVSPDDMALTADGADLSADAPEAENTGVSASAEFKVGNAKVKFKADIGDEFGMTATLESPNFIKKEGSTRSLSGKFELGITDLKATNKIDFSWFKLKEASLRVDYKSSAKFEADASVSPVNKLYAPKLSNGNGKFLTNLKKSVWKDAKSSGGSGAQTIKIASVEIYSIGVARVCLDINFIISIEGSFSVSITEHGSKGLEYKNGNLRAIKVSDKDIDAQVKAKIEATVGVGPALYTIGLKKSIIGAQVKFGAGAAASYTVHLADSDNHLLEEVTWDDIEPEADGMFAGTEAEADAEAIAQIAKAQGGTYTKETSGPIKLHFDRCIDVSCYFILRIGLMANTYAEDIVGKLDWEFFGEKNAKFMNLHVENGDWAKGFSNIAFGSKANTSQCTFEYKPFDQDANATTDPSGAVQPSTNAPILTGDSIELGEIKTNLRIGDKYYVIITALPKGYTLDDLTLSSGDSKIAEVDSNGIIIAKSAGTTTMTIATKDGKFSSYLAVTVIAEEMDDINHLSNRPDRDVAGTERSEALAA